MSWLFLGLALVVMPLGSTHVHRLAPAVEHRAWRLRLPSERAVRVGVAGSAYVVARLADLALAAAYGLAGLCAIRLVGAARRRKRRAREDAQAITAVRALVAELDAGRQLEPALELVDLSGLAVEAVEHAQRVSSGSGAPLVGVLRVVIDDLAEEQDRVRAVQVKVSSSRASATLMASLPIVGVALGTALGADPVGVLARTPLGHGLVLLAVVLESLGLVWTDVIANRASSG